MGKRWRATSRESIPRRPHPNAVSTHARPRRTRGRATRQVRKLLRAQSPCPRQTGRCLLSPTDGWVAVCPTDAWVSPFADTTDGPLSAFPERRVGGCCPSPTDEWVAAVLRRQTSGCLLSFADRRVGVCCPCQIVRSSRRLIYRLLSWNPWQSVFVRLVERLNSAWLC